MYYNGLFMWYDLVIAELKKSLKGVYNTASLNSTIINNIYKQYLSNIRYYGKPELISRSGVAVKWSKGTYVLSSKIASNLQLPQILILNYFLAVYDLAKNGLIDYKYYDPITAKQSNVAKEKYDPGIMKTVYKEASSGLTKITIIAAAAGIIYVLFKFKKR